MGRYYMCTWYRYSTAILRKWGANLLPVAIANSKDDCVLTATCLLLRLNHPPGDGCAVDGASSGHDRHGSALWLAIGVLVTRWVPAFRRQSPRPLGIEWRHGALA